MSILKLPIQINRGETVPTLKEGELFYCTTDNGLYVGTAEGSDVSTILLNETTVNKNVNGYAFGPTKDDSGNDLAYAQLEDNKIQGLQGLTITNDMIKNELPNNGVSGQLVFVKYSSVQEATLTISGEPT